MRARSSLITALALAGLVATASALRARAMDHHVAAATYEDVYYLPPAGWLPLISLGHQEALADLLWMRALVYFGDEMMERGRLVHVFDYTDAILMLDPEFNAVYHWIGTAGVYQPTEIALDDVQRAITVMRTGVARFPDDGELAWTLGATLAFELPPLLDDPRAKDQARSEAADYLAIAARLGATPSWAVLANATMFERVGRAEAAVAHLEEMYATISDESVRAQIEATIAHLRSDAYADAFAEANQAEETARLRELPYVHPDLYFLLGPRPGIDTRRAYVEGFARDATDDDPVLDSISAPH